MSEEEKNNDKIDNSENIKHTNAKLDYKSIILISIRLILCIFLADCGIRLIGLSYGTFPAIFYVGRPSQIENYPFFYIGVIGSICSLILFLENVFVIAKSSYNNLLLKFEEVFNCIVGGCSIALFGVFSYLSLKEPIWSAIFAGIAFLNVMLLCAFNLALKRYKNHKDINKEKFGILGPGILDLLLIIILLYGLIIISDNSMADKPIIYLYPEEKTNLQVTLGYKDNITTSYPKYEGEGWKVLASPNGELVDLKTGKNLYSLYWEGNIGDIDKSLDEGFVIKGEDVADFLDEKLEILGLNYKEREEFIVYWLPQLEKNKFNYIRFDLTEKCNEYMPLIVNEINEDGSLSESNVDATIRVLMVFKPLNHEIKVQEQILPHQERNGFTVVEWGGSKI